MKNWKTTLSGVLAALPMVLHQIFPLKITLEVASAITTLFIALGFVAAKDNDVTGK